MDLETDGNLTVKELFELLKMLAVEEERLHGSKGYTIDEVAAMMRNAIKEAANHGKTE